jgi:hypothetical protein
MGKVVKKVLPVALLAGGAYFGISGLMAGKTAAATAGGSFFEGARGGLSTALGFTSAAMNVMQGEQAARGLEFQRKQAEQELMIAELAGEQDILRINTEQARIRSIAVAQAAAQGKDITASRSFQRYLLDLDERAERDRRASRGTTGAARRSTGYELAQLSTGAFAERVGGLLGGGRSLLKGYLRREEVS